MEVNIEPRRSTRTKKAVEKYEAPVHVPYTHMNRLANKFSKLKMNNTPVPSPVSSPVPSPASSPESILNVHMVNAQAKEAPIANVNATKIPIVMNAATLLNAPVKKSSSLRKTLKRHRNQSKSRSRGSYKSSNSHKSSHSRSRNKPVTKRILPFLKSKNVPKTKTSPNPKKRVTRRKVVPAAPVRKSTRIATAAKMNKSRSKSRNKNKSKSKNIKQAPPQKRQRVDWKNLMTAFETKTKLSNSSKNSNNKLTGGSLPSGGYDETSEFGPHIPDTDSGDVVLIAKVGDVFTPMSREVYEKEYKGEGLASR